MLSWKVRWQPVEFEVPDHICIVARSQDSAQAPHDSDTIESATVEPA